MTDETILYTDYDTGGARNLLDYLEREGSPLRNRSGDRMTDQEREKFIAKSERHNFQRQVAISPSNRHDLTDREIDRATRRAMNDFVAERRTVDYAYVIHRDTKHPHAQVALTGERRDLYMDPDDIKQTRERAHEAFHDPTIVRDRRKEQLRDRLAVVREERERDIERMNADGIDPGRPTDHDHDHDHDQERDRDRDRDKDQDRDRDRDRDFGMDMGMGR